MSHVCKNCEAVFDGKFCPECGQKRYTNHDKNFAHILEETVHFVTHFEGTLPRTIKAVLFLPAKLSLDYCDGIRKKYYKPISFFLLLVVIYLLFPVFTGLNQHLENYESHPLAGRLFEQQIHGKLSSGAYDNFDALSEAFHHKSEKLSKILLLLLIPLCAAALKFVFPNKKKPMFDHFILATEINSFVILSFFLILPVILELILPFLGVNALSDKSLLYIFASFMLFYFALVFKRFYGIKWWLAVPKAIGFIALYAFCVQIVYKSILFEATMLLL